MGFVQAKTFYQERLGEVIGVISRNPYLKLYLKDQNHCLFHMAQINTSMRREEKDDLMKFIQERGNLLPAGVMYVLFDQSDPLIAKALDGDTEIG